MPNIPRLFFASILLVASLRLANAAPVINEVMFHPAGTPENPAQEWIEIFNPDIAAVDLSGWKFSRGVTFTFPAVTILPPGEYLVIAADVATFNAEHPGFAGQLIGGWTGRLSNSGEQIQLDDALGAKVNDVSYADEGEWALRGRGVLSFGHKGWDWFTEADGGGKTLELRNPALGNGSGQNWGVSTVVGGTPGAVNSLASEDVAPLIKDVKHRPEIPRTTDPIVVSCDLEDEGTGATATLRWRVDGAPTFNTLAMSDTDADGDVEATIPAQTTNLRVIEWYISATDGGLTRTWPAPARTSDPGVLPETFGQVTNALIQVDNNFIPNTDFTVAGNQPIYRLVMTNAERAELVQIGTTSGQEQSQATMNGTFISHDGTGIDVVYNAGFRNRGFSSALGPPNNYHVALRSDDKWNGRSSMALNCRYPYSQALGNTIYNFVGIPPQEPAIVRVRVNGVDLAQTGAQMYGRYVRLEGRGGEWAERHYPNDPDGNFYRLDDHFPGPLGTPPGNLGSGEFRYEGTNPAAYSDTFFKETNQDDPNGYADLINLCRVISAPPSGGTAEQPAIADDAYVAAVGALLDVDEFYRFIAIDALIGNQEGGLQSGRADDASLYRGVVDSRFRFIPHDMDSVFYIGEAFAGNPITRPIFSYDLVNEASTTPGTGVLGLARMFNHPQLAPRYYAAVLEGLNTWFNHATLDPIIDQIMAGWVPASNGTVTPPNDSIAEIKAFIDARRTNVLSQIQQTWSLTVTTAAANTVEGYKQTTNGAATFSGTFNVARTYSVTVNGVLATWNYRTNGATTAGTWTLVVGAGGGGVLNPGLNKVTVNFWDGINGTGNVVQSLTANVFYNTGGGTTIAGTLPVGTVTWTPAGGPYHVTADTIVPATTTLIIQPGTNIHVDENKHILVNGHVQIVGDANHHITLSGVPNLPLKADPADPGLPLTTPKWGGLWLESSNDPNNIISYVDFVDAQDMLSGSRGTSRGCIELKNSQALIDHCTFRGTHLHIIYCDLASVTIQYCTFPDMFAANETPGALDNVSEHIKMINKFPAGGHCILLRNTFGGNKGHNDVVDIDSNVVPNPILQVRENVFNGQTGDEDLDLGGDVFVDGNVFSHGRKDQWNTPGGYASALTTGDAGSGTTIVASRNIFWDMDHATALKSGTGAIFEQNTAFKLHATYNDPQGRPQRASVITFVVPEEGTTPGDGAYLGNNIFWSLPNVLGQADVGTGGVGTFNTRLQADYNDLDPQIPTTVGANHPGGFFSLGVGNFVGDPKLIDPDNGDFRLAANSPARGASPFGKDLGALVPGGAWITGEPPVQTPSTSATLTVGGPGIFYYKWKLDNGPWSAAIAFDPSNPFHFPRTAPTKRTAQLALTNLSNGSHAVSVVGQDFAGVWQEDAAATVSKTWTVDTSLQLIQINEVLADSATLPDTIELTNNGADMVNIGGWSLTDDPATPAKYLIPANTMIPAGDFLTITSTTSGIALDRNGATVYLYNGAMLVDSIAFGNQIADLTIGRIGTNRAWTLCTPTLGSANVGVRLGNPSAVRINEWFTSGDVLYDSDWIELSNPQALPVNLAGLHITDNRSGDPLAHTFAPLTFIAANGYARFIADNNPAQGPSHLGFALDAQQESIALLDASGATVDAVFFYPQTTDRSMGRDANGNLVFYELPTRGFLNGTGDPAYANALEILRHLRISELMFNAVGGPDFDYVELTNTGAMPLALGGVRFVQGITFTFPAMTLNPGEFVVVVKHLAKFRSRYGNGPVVAGVFSGQLDNGGETLGLQLSPPFDANALTFAYNDTWYPITDGNGRSLVVIAPSTTAAGKWGDRNTWQPSAQDGGNPAGTTATPLTFSGWSALHIVQSVASDDDFDGVPALAEFSLGMSNESPNGNDGQAGLPVAGRTPDGRATLSFLVPENAAAAQNHGFADVVYNVQAANALGGWTTIATKSFGASWSGTGTATVGAASGGFVPVMITDPFATAQRFLRLQLSWTP